ncbi:MAG: hypothetical protein IKR50_07545 [Prevotella sp.]|nr:hypothetical protein [Prevotella sp.]
MKKKKNVFSMGFLGKFVLIVALFVGGGSIAWADTVIFNGSLENGWNYKNGAGTNLSVTSSVLSNYNSSESTASNIRYYTSDGNITISSGQRIAINAKKYGTTAAGYIKVKYSSDNGETWTTAKEYTYTSDLTTSSQDLAEVNDIVGTYKIQFEFLYATINSIILKDAPTNPILSITHPAEGDVFGYIKESTSKTYTVMNIGTGSMDVNITSSNSVFTVSESSLTEITNDGTGKTFNVIFNYDANVLEPQKAIITVTPTFEGGAAHSFEVSAGPDVECNEDKATIWTTGTKNVYVKYTANNGWNTISLPIAPNLYKNQLFGSGATIKAYALNSYDNNGTLTFENANYLGAGTPYLIYVENAASSPFVVESIYVGYTTAGKVSKGNATFQGTFAPINMEGKYGVTSAGQVMQGTATANIKGYRAYFTGISAPAGGARPTIVFEDDEDTQGLSAVMWMENTKDAYNLQGQKVEKGRKGIYIVNGRKVVIK